MRKLTVGTESYNMLREFETKGFVSNSDKIGHFLTILRKRYGEYYRIFKATHHGRKRKDFLRFGSYEIFGKMFFYYYDIRRKDEFVDFLVKKFYEKNPEPDGNIKGVFTRILNYHGLSWIENDEKN